MTARCQRCGGPLDAQRSTKRFCSPPCRAAAGRAVAPPPPPYSLTAPPSLQVGHVGPPRLQLAHAYIAAVCQPPDPARRTETDRRSRLLRDVLAWHHVDEIYPVFRDVGEPGFERPAWRAAGERPHRVRKHFAKARAAYHEALGLALVVLSVIRDRHLHDPDWANGLKRGSLSHAAARILAAAGQEKRARDVLHRRLGRLAPVLHLAMPLMLARAAPAMHAFRAERPELIATAVPETFEELCLDHRWPLQALSVAELWRQALEQDPRLPPDLTGRMVPITPLWIR